MTDADRQTDRLSDRLDDIEARLREQERVAARLGAVQNVLVEDAKTHASKDVVIALDDLTRNQIVPDVATLKARTQAMTDRLDTSTWRELGRFILDVLGFGDASRRPWLLLVLVALTLVAVAGYGLYTVLADPKQRDHERRMEEDAARRAWQSDSLATVLAIERARQASPVQITVPEASVVRGDSGDR